MERGLSLATSRMWLEPWSASHTEMLVRLAAMPEVMRFIGSGAVWPRDLAEQIAAAQREHWERHGFGWRAAVDKATGQQLGLIALNFAGEGTAGVAPDEYEIGWWLGPAAWGRGLAREGAEVVRDEALDVLGAPGVVARLQPENRRSAAVAEAIGLSLAFTTTGREGEPVAVYRSPCRLDAA